MPVFSLSKSMAGPEVYSRVKVLKYITETILLFYNPVSTVFQSSWSNNQFQKSNEWLSWNRGFVSYAMVPIRHPSPQFDIFFSHCHIQSPWRNPSTFMFGFRLQRSKLTKSVMHLAAVLLVVLYGSRTIQRNWDWLEERSLFRSGLLVCPGNAKVHYNIAKEAGDAGDEDTALLHYQVRTHYSSATLGQLLALTASTLFL
jgi:hypothetical protein